MGRTEGAIEGGAAALMTEGRVLIEEVVVEGVGEAVGEVAALMTVEMTVEVGVEAATVVAAVVAMAGARIGETIEATTIEEEEMAVEAGGAKVAGMEAEMVVLVGMVEGSERMVAMVAGVEGMISGRETTIMIVPQQKMSGTEEQSMNGHRATKLVTIAGNSAACTKLAPSRSLFNGVFLHAPLPPPKTRASKKVDSDLTKGGHSKTEWAGKKIYLFSKLPKHIRRQIQMDEVAVYSITDDKTADEITDLLINLPGISSASTVTEGTACVGGNVLSFCQKFHHCNALELDDERFDMLAENVKLCDLQDKVTLVHGDFISKMPGLKQDIVFLDPPVRYLQQTQRKQYLH